MVTFQQVEQAALLPLPPHPWQPVRWTTALVHADCHLQVAHVRYSVPYTYVGQRLEVRVSQQTVEIYTGATLVATHLRATQGRVTRLEHYPAAAQAYLRATPDVCRAAAAAIGPATAEVVEQVLALPVRYRLREAQAIVRLSDRFATRVEEACQVALAVGDGRYRTVRGVLERGTLLELAVPTATSPVGAFLRGPAAFDVAVQEERSW